MTKQILTCADLKRMGIIESEEESGGVACCPSCEQGTHEESFPHVVITPKKKRVDFCCMCYDYVPVSALVGNEKSNAWIDEALDAKQTENEVTSTIRAWLKELPEGYPPAQFSKEPTGYMLMVGYTMIFQGASAEDAIKRTRDYVEEREGHPNLPVGVIYGIYD